MEKKVKIGSGYGLNRKIVGKKSEKRVMLWVELKNSGKKNSGKKSEKRVWLWVLSKKSGKKIVKIVTKLGLAKGFNA